MSLGDRVHHHKAKLNNDINNYTLRPMQKPGRPEDRKSTTSHFYVTNKRGKRTQNQGDIDSDKQTQGIKNPHKKKL